MNTPVPILRPLNTGDLLDRAISMYRRNFRTLVGIAAIIGAPLLTVQIIFAALAVPNDLGGLASPRVRAGTDTAYLLWLGGTMLTWFFYGVGSIFQDGAITYVAAEWLQGRSATIRQAYGRAFRRGWALFGAYVVIAFSSSLILGALFFPILAMAVAGPTLASSGSTTSAAAAGLLTLCMCAGFIPAILLVFILYIFWTLWAQAIVLEEKGVRAGLGRSWRLVRGSFWRVAFILGLFGILVYVITVTPTSAISFGTIAFGSMMLTNIANTVVSLVVNIFAAPMRNVLLTLLYYDLRVRKEGFDLELQAQQLTQEASVSS